MDPESASKSERTSRLICEFRCCTSLSRHTSEPTRAAALLPDRRSQRRSIDRRELRCSVRPYEKGTDNEQLATRGHHHRRLTGHRREPGDGLPQARLCSGRQLPHDRRERRPDGSDGARRYRAAGRRSAHRRRCHGNFGRVDTVVNNAGIFIPKPFTDYTDEDYDAITGVNLRGFFEVSRAAVAAMLSREGGGHIVNISTSLVDQANSAVPSALTSLTKGGLNAVTKALAVEYAGRGIRSNAVAPGIIRTPMHDPASYDTLTETTSGRSSGRDRRRRRRGALSRECRLRHRRDPACGRRPKCRALRVCMALVSWPWASQHYLIDR